MSPNVANLEPTTPALETHVSKTGTLHLTGSTKSDKINTTYAGLFGGGKINTVAVSLNGEIAATLTEPVKRVSVRAARDGASSQSISKSVTGRLARSSKSPAIDGSTAFQDSDAGPALRENRGPCK